MKTKIQKGRLGEPSHNVWRPKQASTQASAHITLHSCPDFTVMCCTLQEESSSVTPLQAQ